jgi:hypothetical protein
MMNRLKARAFPHLQKTREWFQTKFGKHLNEMIWEDVTFEYLIHQERNFIFCVGKQFWQECQ